MEAGRPFRFEAGHRSDLHQDGGDRDAAPKCADVLEVSNGSSSTVMLDRR
jgi:hypothetical protein